MPFTQGVSGNPAGRPALTDEERAKREKIKRAYRTASKEALRVLYEEVLKNPCARLTDKIAAARIILDRAYGNNAVLQDMFELPEDNALTINIIKKQKGGERDGIEYDENRYSVED